MLEFTQILVLHNTSHICYKMHKKLWGVMFYSGSVLLYILYVCIYIYILFHCMNGREKLTSFSDNFFLLMIRSTQYHFQQTHMLICS